MPSSVYPVASPERIQELQLSLSEIRERVHNAWAESQATSLPSFSQVEPTLVAVSKYKPASDIMACYHAGQRDFGENYVQELVEKANKLPLEIRWHFIGTLQSNKAKTLAAIPNLHTLQTLTSIKSACALNAARPLDCDFLNIMIQINTSGEDSKSGLPPLSQTEDIFALEGSEVAKLAKHIVADCPRLRLVGLMTIGSLQESCKNDINNDFERLRTTRDMLEDILDTEFGSEDGTWGLDGRLILSMGMSSDFEVAIHSGSDVARVGTGIFGERVKKTDVHRI